MRRPKIRLVPLGRREDFEVVLYSEDSLSLRELLRRAPALSTQPIGEELLDRLVGPQLEVTPADVALDQPLYIPPGLTLANDKDRGSGDGRTPVPPQTAIGPGANAPPDRPAALRIGGGLAADVEERNAVLLVYSPQIDGVASFLRAGLSVLVLCDKLVVKHLWDEIVKRAGLRGRLPEVSEGADDGLMGRAGLRQRQLDALRRLIKDLKDGDILVIPHLDLLAGGSENNLPTELRELIELVYTDSDRLLLAFADRTLPLPEVLAARFAARVLISGVVRMVVDPDGTEHPLGEALVAPEEASKFQNFDAEGLYKNVAGMNPVRLRHAIRYAVKQHADKDPVPVDRLYRSIREFKAQTSANFEVPNVSFKDIGGYDDVKAELMRALRIMAAAYHLPNPKLQHELIPRGFIFHGPPGTGKTLFAKAIANQLNATIQVVSGPEITDMYVGESERKVREIFAEARRNAPAVLVFDEFDSIATRRSGRDDGGSRAGNAVVAQILTEMDGFRPDVAMLVIGTTNRLEIVDDALLRPSRFQPIQIDLPNRVARLAIARVHAQHFGIEIPGELLEVIATATEGFNGDEIRSLFRDACVGLYCEDRPIEPDAQRFGWLVGRVRQAHDRLAAARSARGPAQAPAAGATARGGRIGPSGSMVSLMEASARLVAPR